MRINQRLIQGALFLAAAFLTACGGGGGGAAPAPATTTYTIGGSISGHIGTVQLQNNAGDTLTVGAGVSTFTFNTALADGAVYLVTVLSPPTGQTCTANPYTGTVAGANVTTVSVVCSTNSYFIGGSVNSLAAGTDLVLHNGTEDLTITGGGAGTDSFTFVTKIAHAGGYAVTVLTQPLNQRCTVTSGGTGSNVVADVTDIVVDCVPLYSIGGTITGLGTSIGLVLQNNNGDNLTFNGTGDVPFTFATKLASTESYKVKVMIQPAAPALTCLVTNGTGTVAGANVTDVSIACAPPVPHFAYVANYNSVDVSHYSIDDATGVVSSAGSAVLAGTAPQSIIVTPSGQFAYVANLGDTSGNPGDISAYAIDAVSGVLASVPCGAGAACNSSYFPGNFLAGLHPNAITVDPSSRFAYVANVGDPGGNNGDISAYAIDAASGVLTSIPCGVGAACNAAYFPNNFLAGLHPSSVTVDHTGRFAYVSNANEGSVSAFTIDPVTGALTQVPCVLPYICEVLLGAGNNFLAGNGIQSLDVDPTSHFAFTANVNDGSVSAFTIDATTGALTQVDCGGGATCVGVNFLAGTNPTSIAVDPYGKYVYVANKGSLDISAYSITLTGLTAGMLTPIDADTVTGGIQNFAAGTGPTSITIDLSGRYVYVANYNSNDISAYDITPGTGFLTQINCGGVLPICNGANFLAGTNPSSVITTVTQ